MKTNANVPKLLLYLIFVLFVSCHQRTSSASIAASPDIYTKTVPYTTRDTDSAEVIVNTSNVNEYAKEVTLDGQTHFLQNIKEHITEGKFAEAKRRFYYINKNFPPKGPSGVDIYSTEQQNLYDEIKIDLKVHRIMNNKHEPNPLFQFVNAGDGNATRLKVINETPYQMSLAFSGTHSVEIRLAPGKSQVVPLEAGQYNSVATLISSFNTAHFAGTENFKAGDYQVTYAIKNI